MTSRAARPGAVGRFTMPRPRSHAASQTPDLIDPAPDPSVPAGAEPELTAALPLRWWSWTLPRPLERRFAAHWAAEQSRPFLVITVVGTLAFLGLTIGDDAIAPRSAGVLDALRWSIVAYTGLFLAARALSRRRRWSVPPWVWSLCYATGATTMSAYVAVINRAAPTEVESVRCSAILLIFLSTTLVARLPLGMCLLSGVASIGLYAAVVSPVGGPGHAVVSSNLLLFVMSFGFTAAVRWSIDRSQRAAWVLHELDVVRRADLTVATEALRQLGMRDPLTGLGNRRRLDDVLRGPDLSGRPLLVIALDIDDFKAYNDSYGHLGGDACLRAVAGALADSASRLGGVATRVGGEEFTLVVPDAGPTASHDVAGAVCAAVRALALPHAASRCSDVVTVSVGVVAVAAGGDERLVEVGAALLAADRALYQAKTGGRDRWVLATTNREEVILAARAVEHRPTDRAEPGIETGPGERKDGLLTKESVDHYWAQSPAVRQRRVSALAIGFMPVVILQSLANASLFPDVATRVVLVTAAVEVLAVIWFSIAMRWRLPWPWRVRPLAAVVALLGFVLLWGAHESQAPLALVSLLSLVLLPMFLAFVVGVPTRPFVVVCLLLFGGLLAVTYPLGDPQTSVATNVVKVDLIAGIYAIVGNHLLQRSRRLEFSLGVRERELAEALRAQRVNLEVLATCDPLTGLTNRRAFEHHLSTAQRDAAAADAPVALLLLDVDHFKGYNDAAGHAAGDEVLRRLGGTLASWAVDACHDLPVWTGPPAALASRWGGEEFGVLLPGVTAPVALALAEEVRRVVAELALPHPCSPVAQRVTVSIGVATLATITEDAAPDEVRRRLLAQADEALYRAKDAGRDRVAE